MDKTLLHTTMLSAVNAYERREEVVSLLAKLPPKSKKVLAMYYHENMRLQDIATCLGVTESEVREIHAQAVESIHLRMVK